MPRQSSTSLLQAVQSGTMSRDRSDEPIVPSWDGEISGWSDYARRVRLCFSQTMQNKRHTLGPRLVLKLRGRAREVAATIDHDRLESANGAQYLRQFLKDRLGRLPIPDIGQHLEELFVKCRRQQGVDMVTWCNTVRETHRKVQRSMARNGVSNSSRGVQTDFEKEPSSPPSLHRRASASEPHREPGESEEAAGAQPVSPTSPLQVVTAKSSSLSTTKVNHYQLPKAVIVNYHDQPFSTTFLNHCYPPRPP